MAEYIDRKKAIEFAKQNTPNLDGETTIKCVERALKNVPTADVVEVKHGEWIDRYNNKYANHLYICSVCGGEALYEFYANELGQTKSRQALTVGCPHCLAKMDKRSEDK